jgi:hypothetical protein
LATKSVFRGALNTFCWTQRAQDSYVRWNNQDADPTKGKGGAMRDWAQRRLYCSRQIWGCGHCTPDLAKGDMEHVAAGHAVRRRVQNGFGVAGFVQAQGITNPAARFTRRLARLVPSRSPPETARTWARSRRRRYLAVPLVQAARVMPVKLAVSRMMPASSARARSQ